MSGADFARLVALGAIWGASFIFQRVAAPVLGALWTSELRVLLAGLALVAWFRVVKFDPQWRVHWKAYAAVGLVNSALPFSFYGYAAIHAPAGLLALLNASAPLFGALFGLALLGERLTLARVAGLACGLGGVALVARPDLSMVSPAFGWAVAASLAACACYGFNGVVMRKLAHGAPARGIAVGSQLFAALWIAPLLPFVPAVATPTPLVIAAVATLAILCSAIAYLLYFRLIADIGNTGALTVTYLVPIFGVLWGWLLLDEAVTLIAVAGGVLILAGVLLVTRR